MYDLDGRTRRSRDLTGKVKQARDGNGRSKVQLERKEKQKMGWGEKGKAKVDGQISSFFCLCGLGIPVTLTGTLAGRAFLERIWDLDFEF